MGDGPSAPDFKEGIASALSGHRAQARPVDFRARLALVVANIVE
jgi:hypothetical protein